MTEDLLRQALKALEPFEAFFTPEPKWMPDNHALTSGSPMAKRQITAADFRLAASTAASIRAGLEVGK